MLAELQLRDRKPKTMCTVTTINTIVIAIELVCLQSVQALVTELYISGVLSMRATPPPFAYYSQELIFGGGWHNLC